MKSTNNETVHLDVGATVHVSGIPAGTLHVSSGATAFIEPSGSVRGTLHNNGTVYLRGVFGGLQNGDGNFVAEGSSIKQPTETRDGNYIYSWK